MSAWQPIETAPKDGTQILAWFGVLIGVRQVAWEETRCGLTIWAVDDGKFGPYALRGYSDPFPTKWRPLPKPPKETP